MLFSLTRFLLFLCLFSCVFPGGDERKTLRGGFSGEAGDLFWGVSKEAGSWATSQAFGRVSPGQRGGGDSAEEQRKRAESLRPVLGAENRAGLG